MDDTGNVLLAFLLTLGAGLATSLGAGLAFFSRRTNTTLLATALGFSAGVMVYVSFMEIMVKANESLSVIYGPEGGAWASAGGFFGGILLIAIIDRLVPEHANPHEVRRVEEVEVAERHHSSRRSAPPDSGRLLRMGLFAALAIAIHNFPEGLATFASALEDPGLGISIAVAIAIHNIPEGIAVSVPVFYATGSRGRAFWLASLSGLAEPLGALLGWFVLTWLFHDAFFGIVFAGVAGVMVFISFDELLPTAEEYGSHHRCIYGFIVGMAVMALSLLLF